MIDIWYGTEQRFGHMGIPQRWINILGRVHPEQTVQLHYRLDDNAPQALSIGPDGHRLGMPGDFNVELPFDELTAGQHTLTLIATHSDERTTEREVKLLIEKGVRCDLPYHICWNQVSSIQNAAQVVDGRWLLTSQGVRVVEPYYDRVIALGDRSWTDYEVRTTVIFHGLREPSGQWGDAGANVTHAAIAVRWPGHDTDGHQPHVKWFPLGATAEFRVNLIWQECRWRILGGGKVVVEATESQPIALECAYAMKHRVESTADGTSRYRVKLWEKGTPEPSEWAVELQKDITGVQQGGALLIAHYSEATFGDVEVIPV